VQRFEGSKRRMASDDLALIEVVDSVSPKA